MKRFFSVFAGVIVCVAVVLGVAAGGFALIYTPSLSVDISSKTGEVTNGASGYLYGLAEVGVPSKNMVESVDISTVSQKVPFGLQHPIGDIDHVYTQLENTTYDVVYLQDIYSTWYYEQENIEKLRSENKYDCKEFVENDYLPKVKQSVEYLKNTPYSDKVVYCIYNECDNGVWFGETKSSSDSKYGVYGSYTKVGAKNFFEAWKETYALVKSIDENALIGGPGFCDYDDSEIEEFFTYCVENDCVPDVCIYHELGGNSIYQFSEHTKTFKSLEEKLKIDEMPIIVTEYGEMQDNGKPGKMLQFVTQIENSKVYGDNAYWRLANNLCDVAADDNSPNSNWWLYRWYTEMQGQTLESSYQDLFKSNLGKFLKGKANLSSKGFMGIASVDDGDNKIEILCGGRDGSAVVKLKNIDKTPFYNQNVNIKIEEVLYKGISGVVTSSVEVKSYSQTLNKDKLLIDMNDLDEANVYKITIEKSDEKAQTYQNDGYIKRYEFEEGNLLGKAYAYDSAYATTGDNEGMVGGIENDGDGVSLEFSVPKDGTYDLNFIYGNGNDGEYDENGKQNPNDRTYSTAILRIDDDESDMTVPNTIKSEYTDCFTKTVTLKAGEHKLIVTHKNGTLVLDSLLVTYNGAGEEISVLNDIDRTNDSTNSFLLVVKNDGYYNISSSKKATAFVNENKVTLDKSSVIYLMRGLNYVDVKDKSVTSLSVLKYDEKAENIVLNADDFKLLGGAKCSENSVLKIKYLDAISSKSGKAQANIKADKSGVYALTFTYSNNAEGGHHAYNVDLIEQYVTLDVGGKKQDVWARNTYSFDTYKTVTVYAKLKSGNNKITLSNSGKTKFDNQESFAPKISSVSLNELEKQ